GTGLTYQWQSSPDNATWSNVTGATTTTYNATVTTAIYYRLVVTCTGSGLTAATSSVFLNMTASPGPINSSIGVSGGPFMICNTLSGVTLTDAVTGGTWTNAPTTVGTVSSTGAWSSTGVVGYSIVSYTIGTCSATAIINIDSTPTVTA